MVDMILWENYKKICFIAPFLAPQWPVYAIVTAWNPASCEVGMRRNTRRQRALWRGIVASPTPRLPWPLWWGGACARAGGVLGPPVGFP
ncbi:hypothetical protein ACLH0B_20745, partial [Aeromonas salmonicida]